jgi:hypothetical protein
MIYHPLSAQPIGSTALHWQETMLASGPAVTGVNGWQYIIVSKFIKASAAIVISAGTIEPPSPPSRQFGDAIHRIDQQTTPTGHHIFIDFDYR